MTALDMKTQLKFVTRVSIIHHKKVWILLFIANLICN
eukprot:SAG25_NODE_899_length_4862_cov_4.370893_5_plen_37_part_00